MSSSNRAIIAAALAVWAWGATSSVAQRQPSDRLNKLIPIFQQGGVAFGAFVPAGDIEAAIRARRSGLDFVIFEMEHANFDLLGLRDSLQFLLDRKQILDQRGLGPTVVPLVRVPPNADEENLWIYKQVLDLGVYGIVTPHFGHSVETARAVISATRYPQAKDAPDQAPPGHRGTSPSAFDYWGLRSFAAYHRVADVWPLDPAGEITLLPLIEDREGVQNLRAVLQEVKGIAGIFAGRVDLATSLGFPGNSGAPAVQAALDEVLAAGKEFNVPVGSLANRRDIVDLVNRGYQFLVTGDEVAVEMGRRAAGQLPAAGGTRPTGARPDVARPTGRLNRVIELLEAGKPVFGSFAANDVGAARSARGSNWDFVIFEMEHAGFSMRGFQSSLQYLLSRGQIKEQGTLAPRVVPLVRIGPGAGEVRRNQWYVKQVLDYGAYGLVVPHLDSVEHALDVIRAARYPQPPDSPRFEPEGHRGTAAGRAQRYWGIPDFKEYHQRAGIWPLDPDGEVLLAFLVEDAAGAAAIRDILARVEGIGVVFIGPADLSTSLGYPGQPDHPEVRAVIDQIAQACREAGVPFGITTNRDRIEGEIRAGYQFMVTGDAVAIERGRQAGGR